MCENYYIGLGLESFHACEIRGMLVAMMHRVSTSLLTVVFRIKRCDARSRLSPFSIDIESIIIMQVDWQCIFY